MEEKDSGQSLNLIDAGDSYSYLTRCVALATLLTEIGVIDELLESGRLIPEELDRRVELLEKHFPSFKNLKMQVVMEDGNAKKGG